jgi:tetratricopeptide (TPR) repeat protein
VVVRSVDLFCEFNRRIEDVMKALVAVLLFGSMMAAAQDAGSSVKMSPAERGIATAQRMIEKNPKNYDAYNGLAFALSRRARETSDVRFYNEAEQALQKSFAIAPGNLGAERIGVWLLLGKHEFAAARESAQKLSKRVPDDIMVYGFLTDANVELGNYDEAETAAQWMLDLRAGNMPGLTRAAYLRELFGDVDGSLELMQMAYGSTPPSELEDRAWILTQMAHLNLSVGNANEAESELKQALELFPGYHYALANMAKVRTLQKRYDEAVTLLQQRYDAAPHAENLFDLALALQSAGRDQEAGKAFAEFERKSLAETMKGDNSNHELIYYYADVAKQPAKALEVASREIARRHDVFTLDAYAWALYQNAKYAEARKQSQATLKVGIRDARMFRHAGEIALKCGDKRAAEQYLSQAAAMNSMESDLARASLEKLNQVAMN